jgi:DNA-binding CsgD family transcriptional regulator
MEDKRQNLLAENESKRLDLRLPMLVCYTMYCVWQMGVMFFSGTTLSLDGKTPIPFMVNNQIITALVMAGYTLSIVHLIFLQRYCVVTARIGISIALLSVLALYMPFTPQTLAVLYYIQAFCCVLLLGILGATVINLFTETTVIKNIILELIMGGCLIAILQNDIIPMPFNFFRHIIVTALAMLLLFFFKLPSKVWPDYVRRSDSFVKPQSLIVGLSALVLFSSVIVLFGSIVAESMTHGVFVYYVFNAASGVILAVLWKFFNIIPLKSASSILAVGAFGFVTAIASLYLPVFSLPACALLGVGSAVCMMSTYFGVVMAKRYPSVFVAPGLIGLGFTAVIFHTVLLETLRTNLPMLYVIYLVIAVALTILYLILEPYLSFSFREGTPPASATPGNAASAKPTGQGSFLGGNWRKILQANAFEPLSDGELDIAGFIMLGYKPGDIAKETRYTLNTVKSYRKELYSKLQIHETRELFARARKMGNEG